MPRVRCKVNSLNQYPTNELTKRFRLCTAPFGTSSTRRTARQSTEDAGRSDFVTSSTRAILCGLMHLLPSPEQRRSTLEEMVAVGRISTSDVNLVRDGSKVQSKVDLLRRVPTPGETPVLGGEAGLVAMVVAVGRRVKKNFRRGGIARPTQALRRTHGGTCRGRTLLRRTAVAGRISHGAILQHPRPSRLHGKAQRKARRSTGAATLAGTMRGHGGIRPGEMVAQAGETRPLRLAGAAGEIRLLRLAGVPVTLQLLPTGKSRSH